MGGGGLMAINNNGSNMFEGTETEVKIRLKGENSDLMKSIKQVQSQIDRMDNIEYKGSNHQRGFVSTSQVRLFERLYAQAQRSIQDKTDRLAKMQEDFDKREQSVLRRRGRLFSIKNNLDENGVQAGDPLYDKTVEHIKIVNKQYDELQRSKVDARSGVDAYKKSLENMTIQMEKAQRIQERFGELYESNVRDRYVMHGAGAVVS